MEATLTFPRFFARQAYWREFPPAHVLLRSIAVGLGVFKPAQAKAASEGMAALRAMFPGGRF